MDSFGIQPPMPDQGDGAGTNPMHGGLRLCFDVTFGIIAELIFGKQ